MKRFKLLLFGLTAGLAIMIAMPAQASPGEAFHRLRFEQPAPVQLFCALPEMVADVPKTKVFTIKRYFGMIVSADISFKYHKGDIRLRHGPYDYYLLRPPSFS